MSDDPVKLLVTVDVVIFGYGDDGLTMLLIKRGIAPYKGSWALPGGFVLEHEDLEEAAMRELAEEAGVQDVYIEQLFTFGRPGRDPRGRVVTVGYFALTALDGHHLRAASDAEEAAWFPIRKLPAVAFDHDDIIQMAIGRLKAKIRYEPIGFELLPLEFSLSQLQSLYEAVLERQLDKRNFRKKILDMGILRKLDKKEVGVPNRPSWLYSFHRRKYEQLKKHGFYFEI